MVHSVIGADVWLSSGERVQFGPVQGLAGRARAIADFVRGLAELMGDLGLPGSVVQLPDDAAQKNLWEVRKAGLNIMMSLKGDGKPNGDA